MYRVELKATQPNQHKPRRDKYIVPNVPCGVERLLGHKQLSEQGRMFVPNVPCGVERSEGVLKEGMLVPGS